MILEPVDLSRIVFDPAAMLSALSHGEVDFVVIGGIAAILHGDDAGTGDADTTVRRTRGNLQALSGVLGALDGRLLVMVNEAEEAVIDVPVTADTFTPLTSARFLTRHGVLDVVLHPDGIPHYDDWAANATLVDIGEGVRVAVASLDDIIRSKEAAGRDKDTQALPRLRALRAMARRHRTGDPEGP